MGFFDHHHWWRPVTGTNVVRDESGRPYKSIILQQCGCGAVRSIELEPGQAPVVRIAIQ